MQKTIVYTIFLIMLAIVPAWAQTSGKMLSYPPKAEQIPGLMVLKNQLDAKIDYIGRRYSVDMWLASKDGATQVIYTTLDGRGLLTNGFLFDSEGNVVTEKDMADVNLDEPSYVEQNVQEFKEAVNAMKEEPSTRLWRDLSHSSYIPFGAKNAPIIYVFADARCPYCKKFWKELEPYIDRGALQVRMVLVGILGDMSIEAGAQILSQIDKQGAWMQVANGTYKYSSTRADTDAKEMIDINTKLMQNWKMSSTPFSVYKDKFGKVLMLRGYTQDIEKIVNQATRK